LCGGVGCAVGNGNDKIKRPVRARNYCDRWLICIAHNRCQSGVRAERPGISWRAIRQIRQERKSIRCTFATGSDTDNLDEWLRKSSDTAKGKETPRQISAKSGYSHNSSHNDY
jgi:hypothetical protein